jgi:heat shock protein HtpX
MVRNTLKTTLLLAFLGALLVGLGSIYGQQGAVIGLGFAVVFIGGSFWFSDRIAIAAARAVPLSPSSVEGARVARIVGGLAERMGMPMPALYISPNPQPNAFATGRGPHHAAVCVTQGILPMLDDRELEGVLAHEMSHVANRDILIGSVAAAIASALTMVARFGLWGSMMGRRRTSGILAVFGLILAPLAALLIQLAVTRTREYEADRSGAMTIGDGGPLASALIKIDAAARSIPMNVDPAHASAYIVNPFTGRQFAFGDLFRTHPSTADRIERLRHITPTTV